MALGKWMPALVVGLTLAAGFGSTGQAQQKKSILGTFGGTPYIKTDDPCEDRFRRAGNPQCVSWLATPSETPRYSGGYVGGGTAIGGEPRYECEGTWGWDYAGFKLPARIWLRWSHGRRYQGGAGAYKVDGPNLLH